MPPFSMPVASTSSLIEAPAYPRWLKTGAARSRIMRRVASPLRSRVVVLIGSSRKTDRSVSKYEAKLGGMQRDLGHCPVPAVASVRCGAMCGRFVQASSPELLVERFGVDELAAPAHEPSYNVAPRATVYAVRDRAEEEGRRALPLGAALGVDPLV